MRNPSRFGVALLAGLFLLLQSFALLAASGMADASPRDAFGRILCTSHVLGNQTPGAGGHDAPAGGAMDGCACCLCCEPATASLLPPEPHAPQLPAPRLAERLVPARAVHVPPLPEGRPGEPRGPPTTA